MPRDDSSRLRSPGASLASTLVVKEEDPTAGHDVSEEAQIHWFGDPLETCPKKTFQNGMLSSYTEYGVARPGMTNPPMHPEARRKCLAYLKTWDVHHGGRPSRRPILPAPRGSASSSASSGSGTPASHAGPAKARSSPSSQGPASRTRSRAAGPCNSAQEHLYGTPDGSFSAASDTAAPSLVWTACGDASPGASLIVASFPEGSQTNILPVGVAARGRAASSASNGQRKIPGIPAWLTDVKKMQEEQRAPPEPGPGEFRRWRQVLDMKGYEHGRELDRREVSDLAQLKCYHSRSSQARSKDHAQPEEGRAAKDVEGLLKALNRSHDRMQYGGGRKTVVRVSSAPEMPRQEKELYDYFSSPAPTASYLGKLALLVENAGPNRMEWMAKHARLSMATGGKLPALGPEEADSS